MMLFANLSIVLGTFFLFLYIFWKRLRDDYSSEIIFSTGTTSFLSEIVFWYLSTLLAPDYFFWLAFLGAIVGLFIGIYRFRMKIFETLDAFILASVPTLTILFLVHSVRNSSFVSFISFLVTLFLIFVFYVVDLNYKKMRWYKSGKIGISGLITMLTFFVIRAVTSLAGIDVLTFTGYELYFSIGVVILVGVGIFYLANVNK